MEKKILSTYVLISIISIGFFIFYKIFHFLAVKGMRQLCLKDQVLYLINLQHISL